MLYLVNASSINMLNANSEIGLKFKPISLDEARCVISDAPRAVNAIGHVETDRVVRDCLARHRN